jgi:hypothetical protein
MNRKIGMYSSVTLTIMTLLFALGMIIGNSSLSYFVCIVLSWSYIMLTCTLGTEVSTERKAAAYGGMIFAGLYGVFITLVYFTQLTTVAYQTAASEILKVLSYESLGSLMFNLDLLGYGLMALSTFFIGMSIEPRNKVDKWLKILLMIHGVFAPTSVLLPMLNIFSTDMGSSGANIGITVLLVWCAYIAPTGVLAILHFKKENQADSNIKEAI